MTALADGTGPWRLFVAALQRTSSTPGPPAATARQRLRVAGRQTIRAVSAAQPPPASVPHALAGGAGTNQFSAVARIPASSADASTEEQVGKRREPDQRAAAVLVAATRRRGLVTRGRRRAGI